MEQEDGQARIMHASASQYLFSEHASALASDPPLDKIVLMTCVDFLLSNHETNYAIDLDGAFQERIAWRRGAYDYLSPPIVDNTRLTRYSEMIPNEV